MFREPLQTYLRVVLSLTCPTSLSPHTLYVSTSDLPPLIHPLPQSVFKTNSRLLIALLVSVRNVITVGYPFFLSSAARITGSHSDRRTRYLPHVVLPLPSPPRPIQKEPHLDMLNV